MLSHLNDDLDVALKLYQNLLDDADGPHEETDKFTLRRVESESDKRLLL
jgi:hypothetical protein